MKKTLIIFSVILITILPWNITIHNVHKKQVNINNVSEHIKIEQEFNNNSLIINDQLFYNKRNDINDEKIYSIDSNEFTWFLTNLVNNIKLFLEKNPTVILMNQDELIKAYLNDLKNKKYYAQTVFETFWWGFKWWITWNDFRTILNNAGNNITRNAISNISVGTMAGYIVQFLAIKFPWILKIPKIGLIIGGTLGLQVAGCLLGRQFWAKKGIIFRMLWFPPVVTGCWDQ
ncbi:hypothetical protein [Spiroplasma melliferum]|uniref:hypothetical protein n=1 Tax=Spiroplasma melliferum TaxID=2134 RepID=UPI000C76F0A1|nr:hypothetical protein [Spiroplasma melliferum]